MFALNVMPTCHLLSCLLSFCLLLLSAAKIFVKINISIVSASLYWYGAPNPVQLQFITCWSSSINISFYERSKDSSVNIVVRNGLRVQDGFMTRQTELSVLPLNKPPYKKIHTRILLYIQ